MKVSILATNNWNAWNLHLLRFKFIPVNVFFIFLHSILVSWSSDFLSPTGKSYERNSSVADLKSGPTISSSFLEMRYHICHFWHQLWRFFGQVHKFWRLIQPFNLKNKIKNYQNSQVKNTTNSWFLPTKIILFSKLNASHILAFLF